MDERQEFYERIVAKRLPSKTQSILVCGGGDLDERVFKTLGFTDVTISNLDATRKTGDFAPFRWVIENAESLSFSDKTFDYVVVHDAIHHASSPHRMVTEMYRVSRKGILAFENRDSALMRILEKFKIAQTYEHIAVYKNSCAYGGVNNTEIPNFIYRWTEREIEKTIKSYAPFCPHKFSYDYGTAFPYTPQFERRCRAKFLLIRLLAPIYSLLAKVMPRQQNLFAFYVEKSETLDSLYPWLTVNDKGEIRFNEVWGDNRYKKTGK